LGGVNKRALLFAFAAAVAGFILLQLYVRRFEQEVRGGDPVDILLARRDIPAGSIITAQHVAEYRVPERYSSARNVSAGDLRNVVGTRVSTTVRANEPLLWTDIARMREDRTLAGMVQPGMVAAPVSAQGFSGLVGPGDRVDVVLVLRGSENPGLVALDGTRRRATTLIQAALVLSLGGSMDRGASGTGEVTLLLTPEQAQLLLIARDNGALQLVLRNPDDITIRDALSAVTTQDLEDPKKRETFVHSHLQPNRGAKRGASSAE
jgi:pilus assembly protein CpaB